MELHLVQPDLPGGPPVIGGCCRSLSSAHGTETEVRLSCLQPTLLKSATGRSDRTAQAFMNDSWHILDESQRLT